MPVLPAPRYPWRKLPAGPPLVAAILPLDCHTRELLTCRYGNVAVIYEPDPGFALGYLYNLGGTRLCILSFPIDVIIKSACQAPQ